SMYFLVSRMLTKFRFINYSLVVILAFVGTKMLLSHHVKVPEWISLPSLLPHWPGESSLLYTCRKRKRKETGKVFNRPNAAPEGSLAGPPSGKIPNDGSSDLLELSPGQ
ncbi:MAG: hypothetical protein ACO3AE_11575, partial [Robiginitalea sp.]